MKFLFSHRNFPAQFRHIITELGCDPENEIAFLCNTSSPFEIKGVRKILYRLKRTVPKNCHRYLRQYEESIIHGQAAAEAAIALKNSGFIPDVIYSHAWGNSMFFKDVFPDIPSISYCEWFYNPKGADTGFNKNEIIDIDKKALIKCNNSQFLQDLISSDIVTCPTKWQKSQFPKIFQNKIEVIHDGIDTEYFVPNPNTVFKIPNSDVALSSSDEVLTYATRGMEPYRGFPQFMEAVEVLLKKRPDLHVVIAGEDRICYGPKLANGSYKEIMLKKLDLDLARVHFTGGLPYMEYKKLLQISRVHCYLTVPFILSWSFLEAMSTGCCIVSSDTAPVKEVMKHNYNGILTDFFDKKQLIKSIEYALDNCNTPLIQEIRNNARKTIIDNYDLKKFLPKHIELIKNAGLKK